MEFLCARTIFQKKKHRLASTGVRQKRYQISVKIWVFDDLFHKKGLLLVILVPGMIQLSRSGSFFWVKEDFWGCGGQWGCRGRWGQWGYRGSKAWKITNEDFSHPGLEFSFILMFLKKNLNKEMSCWTLALFLSEAVEARRCYFFEKWLWHPKIPYLSIPEPSSNQI